MFKALLSLLAMSAHTWEGPESWQGVVQVGQQLLRIQLVCPAWL
jgi:hypothetical protein